MIIFSSNLPAARPHSRARQGMVIFVPVGNPVDPTRHPSFYDETFNYLLRCGLTVLQKNKM